MQLFADEHPISNDEQVNLRRLLRVIVESEQDTDNKSPSLSDNSASRTVRILSNSPSEYYIRLEHLESGYILTVFAGSTFGREIDSLTHFLGKFDTISRRQFILSRKPDGCYYLMDTNSTNGTFVNDRKCDPKTHIRLSMNDTVRTGDQSFRIVEVKRDN
jgi:pSer/pThr/pTyr-binding forkhead associated (FHA) protein